MYRVGFLLIAGSLLAIGPAPGPAAGGTPADLNGRPYVNRSSLLGRADTLRAGVVAGEPLVLALPDTIAGRQVAAYATVRAPALSRRIGHAFFWQTRPQEAGRHRLLFAATFADALTDTLVVFVTVEAGRDS